MPAPDPSYRGWQRFLDRAVLWSCSLLIEGAVFLLTVVRRETWGGPPDSRGTPSSRT